MPRPARLTIRFEVAAEAEASEESAMLEARMGESTVRESLDVVSSGPHVLAPGRVAGTPAAPIRFQVSATGSAIIKAAGLPQGSVFDTNSGISNGTHSASIRANTRSPSSRPMPWAPEQSAPSSCMSDPACPSPPRYGIWPAALDVAPRAISSVTGWFLSDSDTPTADPSGSTASLNHSRVLVNGAYAAILSASAGQVQFLCPGPPAGTPLDIAVETPAGQSSALRTIMEETAPAILTVDGAPQGHALAIHPNSAELAALPSFRYPVPPRHLWPTDLRLGNGHPNARPPGRFG